jgi:hypothetical protein
MRSKEGYGLTKGFSGARIQRRLKVDVKDSQINQLVDTGFITNARGFASCILICDKPRWRPKRLFSSLE